MTTDPTTDLVMWLRAALDARSRELDEDERVAREATQGEWRWADPGGRFKMALVSDKWPDERMIVPSGSPDVYPSRFDADHIVRWDPARVLAWVATERAEVAATRRILDLHAETAHHECQICGERGGGDWPCPTVRLLALPMDDRPSYLDEWRP